MTWTLIVTGVTQTPTGQEASCVLTDGVSKFPQSFQTDGTTASLKAQAQSATTRKDTIAAKPDLFVGLTLDLSPDAPPSPPTKAEADRAQFFADVAAARQQDKLKALSPELYARCLPEYVKGL